MTNLLEELDEYFEKLFSKRYLDICRFSIYEFCDLKFIKDIAKEMRKESSNADYYFVEDLIMLYLYLTKSIHLQFDLRNEDTKRAGVDIIQVDLKESLKEFRIFVLGSIKSMFDGKNLDSECLDVFKISKKDHEEFLRKENIRERASRGNPEAKTCNSFDYIRGENSSLNALAHIHNVYKKV